MSEETKKCTKCNKELPIECFSKCKTTKDGLQYYCRECYNEYYQTNKQHISQCHKQYQQANRQYYNQINNRFRKQFEGYYLYIIFDKQDNIVYVGQTTNYYNRLYQHLSGYTNATKEVFDSGDWSKIKYLDVGHIVESEMELRALENELIHLYQPRCNTHLNIIRDIDEDRLFSIVTTLHSMNNEWEEFRTNVY